MKNTIYGAIAISSPFLLLWALFAGMHSNNESLSFVCALTFILGWPLIGCTPIAATLLIDQLEKMTGSAK